MEVDGLFKKKSRSTRKGAINAKAKEAQEEAAKEEVQDVSDTRRSRQKPKEEAAKEEVQVIQRYLH